jgi:hypothetical protein
VSNESTVRNWQTAIIDDCASILKRQLTPAETTFIRSRGGFMALEMIHDHVRGLIGKPGELETYLRSESDDESE